MNELGDSHPDVTIVVHEHEPGEALTLLATDDIDLALTYDYNLAPVSADVTLDTVALWSTPWSLGAPTPAASNVREVRLRVYAHTRRGRAAWPPLGLVLDRLNGPTARSMSPAA